MSELKAYRFLGQDEVWPDANLGSDYYLKSEADKVIAEKDKELRHHKYKRCLASGTIGGRNPRHVTWKVRRC